MSGSLTNRFIPRIPSSRLRLNFGLLLALSFLHIAGVNRDQNEPPRYGDGQLPSPHRGLSFVVARRFPSSAARSGTARNRRFVLGFQVVFDIEIKEALARVVIGHGPA